MSEAKPHRLARELWRDLRGPAIVEYLYEVTHTETGESMSIVQCGDETWAVPEATWGEFFERIPNAPASVQQDEESKV